MRHQDKRELRATKRWFRSLQRGWPMAGAVLCLLAVAPVARAQYLHSPMRIAEGPPGQILVSDIQQDAVLAMDRRSLGIVWTLSVAGTPLAVAQTANLVFVGNATTQNVEVYKLKGAPGGSGKTLEFLYHLGHTPAGQLGFILAPTDMAIDKDLQLVFVLDGKERNVKVFDVRGNFVETLPPSTEPPLLNPAAIAVDELRREILISDYGDPSGYFAPQVPARVMIYTYSGMYLDRIDGNGPDSNFRFPRPQGLAVDSQGQIFMVDTVLGKVLVFDRATRAGLRTLGGFGDAPGQLNSPWDVVLEEKSGDLFVTNYKTGRVEVFRAAGRMQ